MSDDGDRDRQVEYAPNHGGLDEGDRCPLCGSGVLYAIARGDDSITLRCFNCNRQASHAPSVGHKIVVDNPRETPTGFTLSPAQLAARDARDPEEAGAEARTAEAGSGTAPAHGGGWNG